MDIKLIASGSQFWELWVKYWGLSLLIDDAILFDTFANYHVLAKKMRRAKVDISKIQSVVISHDHWDHIGGLWGFLEERRGLDVYLPLQAKESVKNRIRAAGGKVIEKYGSKEVKAGVFVTDEIMGDFDGKSISEQSIVIKSDKGLVVIVGCSHPGILEIVERAKQIFNLPVYGVIGGFHLMHSKAEDIRVIAKKLKNEGVEMVAPTHCAGWRAERIFKNVFHRGFVALCEGQRLTF